MFKTMKSKALLTAIAVCSFSFVWSGPGPVPPGANTNCDAGPKADSLPYTPDDSGFSPLFDGTSFKGWWESCQSHHSSGDKVKGGKFLIDAANHAIYSDQEPNGNAGGLLLTNKKFSNYELVFEYWPTFGNDGGIFNRTTADGKCYQTTLDYLTGSSVGGSFGEQLSPSWNTDPYKFNGSATNVTVATWTTFTSSQSPTKFGCSSGGCVASDWPKIWDVNGWNQVRIKLYGGLATGKTMHMDSWVRDMKTPNKPWVPILSETHNIVQPPNYIGIQIHGGSGSWGGATGNWTRNIKWTPLDDNGVRTWVPSVTLRNTLNAAPGLTAAQNSLQGSAEEDFTINIRDVSGKMLESFSGHAGSFQHEFASSSRGILMVEMKTAHSARTLRVTRLF